MTVELEKSELHIREDNSGLQIYVPRDSRSQDFCYLSKLPPRLFEWMMTHPDTQIREKIEPEAVLVTTKILNANLSSVSWILEESGIIEVPGAQIIDDQGAIAESSRDAEEEAEEEVQRVHDSRPTTPGDISRGRDEFLTPTTSEIASSILTPPSSAVLTTRATSAHSSHSRVVSEVTYGQSRHRSAVAGSLPLAIQRIEADRTAPTYAEGLSGPDPNPDLIGIAVDEETRYVALLDNIIRRARNMSFPTLGAFDMSQLLETLPGLEMPADEYPLDIHRFRSATQRDRDFKVGAAGELFVSLECQS